MQDAFCSCSIKHASVQHVGCHGCTADHTVIDRKLMESSRSCCDLGHQEAALFLAARPEKVERCEV